MDPTPGMSLAENLWVRVLLFDNIKECRLSCESGFNLVDKANGTNAVFNAGPEKIFVSIENGKVKAGEHLFGEEVTLKPDTPFVFSLNGKRYRGNLRLIVNSDSETFDAINVVPAESYLAGVVGAEMPSYWENQALEAQTIAARTYCLYTKMDSGKKRQWDVKATQASQVYRGIAAETKTIWKAIRQTAGKVLVCKDDEGNEKMFPSFYSSTCGGNSTSSEEVFGEDFAALVSVKCNYCRKVAKKGYYRWQPVEYDAKAVSDKIIANYPKLKRLGRIEMIEAQKYSAGRVVFAKLIGKDGKIGTLRGEDLRLTIDPSGLRIKSTMCRIVKKNGKFRFLDGKGFGHGVGMCQCGAEGMARKGKSAEDILGHYYVGSKIVKLY